LNVPDGHGKSDDEVTDEIVGVRRMPWSTRKLVISSHRLRLLPCLMLAVAYAITGRLGLLLAVPPGYATAIFPPAGIAMAAALIGGRRTLPWIFAGSCALNLWVGFTIEQHTAARALAVAAVVAAASAVQAVAGGWALRELIGYPAALDNVRDLSKCLLAAPVLCLTSATLSHGGMAAFGVINTSEVASSWLSWWIGDTLGVLLFLPLVMVAAGEPRALWRGRARTVALPMLLFFALFVAIFVRTRAWERDQSLAEFQLLSQGFADKLQFQLEAQEDFLRQLSAFWNGPSRLLPKDFTMLTSHLLRRFPAIQAIEWAPEVGRAARGAFVASQQENNPSFAIRERDRVSETLQADDRTESYPVTYVEPLQDNEVAVGFDLASDPERRAAILRTIATGTVAATAPIRLVQKPEDLKGILLTLSVPRGPNGLGVLLIVLHMDKFIAATLGPASQQLDVEFFDQAAGQPLFNTLAGGAALTLYDHSISFGGRSYVISTAPTAFYLTGHQGWQSWAVLVVGVLSTSLLGAFLLLSTGERQRFARLLSERTRERDRIWQVCEDLLGVSNFDGYFTSVNPAWTKTLGWGEDKIKALHVNELRHPDDMPIGVEGRRRLAEGAGTVRIENRFRHQDGSYRWIYWTMTAEQGLIYLIGRNVTADREAAQLHRQTEEQLHQLQKMESVGQLTGGIAHDFNNLLTVILGNLEILERSLEAASGRTLKAVRAAMTGATRAVTLTQRLLAYAQRQPLRPRTVDVNELVAGMDDLIRRTQGEIIRYEFALGAQPPFCLCDPNQLETALLNLVINARDAMPQGGRLTVETANVAFEAVRARVRSIAAGSYVMLAVSDTGVGMPRETVERAFEPFFTTKGAGKGTGLGLSMVYGFVKQSNGHTEIESEPGSGTTLRIFLPAAAAGETAGIQGAEGQPLDAATRGASETILVAEDDAGVRGYVVESLRELNYSVMEADDAAAALAIITQADLRIDLLLTDVVMPGMNGRELADRARVMMPNIRVLFMTGYSQDAIVHQGRLDPDIELLEKPFRSESLAVRVRAILDTEIHVT
jgi:PAS domain S-box-containing protein